MSGRTELMSVKATVAEKDIVLRAAKKLGMSYSDYIRMVVLATSRKMGIEERDGVNVEDVRRPYPARRRKLSAPQEDTGEIVAA